MEADFQNPSCFHLLWVNKYDFNQYLKLKGLREMLDPQKRKITNLLQKSCLFQEVMYLKYTASSKSSIRNILNEQFKSNTSYLNY